MISKDSLVQSFHFFQSESFKLLIKLKFSRKRKKYER